MPQQSDYFDSLEAAIAIGHQCQGVHRATVFVHERTQYGLTVWKGNVEVFDLKAHPRAKMCYAWRYTEGNRSKIFTVLGNKLIDSAQRAVQATICMDQQPIKLDQPFTNGLEVFRQLVEQAHKIIHETVIKSEDLEIPVETAELNQWEFQRQTQTKSVRA